VAKMSTRVSIIVLNWNGKTWLEKCLSSILNQKISESFELLLVDNNSSDDSISYVQHRFPQVKVVKLDKNYGFPEGNNRGLKHAQGEYLILVNMDTEADDGWLMKLVQAADEYKDYQILCSIQLPRIVRNPVKDSRCPYMNVNAFARPMLNFSISELPIIDSLFASGGCFLIRKAWLDNIGYLFDPYYFFGAEDLELSLRTILVGGQIGYVRDSRIAHYVGGANFSSQRTSYFGTRNVLLTYYKLFEQKNFIKIFLVQIVYVIAFLFARRKQRDRACVIGMVKGIAGFLSSFHLYRNYQKAFAKSKKRNDSYVFKRLTIRGRLEKIILKKVIYRC